MRTLQIAAAVGLAACGAQAQRGAVDFGMTYSQQVSKFVGVSSSATDFYLRGATMDLSYSFWKGFGVAASGTGLAATNLQTNIDVHQVEMLGGLRYTHNFGHITPTVWARRGGLFLEAKGGYTFATSGLYPVNGVVMDRATSLTYAGGGGYNFHVYHRFDVRVVQAEYVYTQLPNGSTDKQASVRLSTGLNFHFGP